ncbi:hypothetical protein N7453_002523 [Penicillium expansum]|nr:hypothetical protein N7453_002523 [Penicillium expansum]
MSAQIVKQRQAFPDSLSSPFTGIIFTTWVKKDQLIQPTLEARKERRGSPKDLRLGAAQTRGQPWKA